MGNRPVIDHLFTCLDYAGVTEKIVVTGFEQKKIEEHLRGRATFIHNPEFATTNNLQSLSRVLDSGIEGPFLCLHVDLLLHPDILKRVVETSGRVVICADQELLEETMKVATQSGRVSGIGKELNPETVSGTFLGIAKFDAQAVARIREGIPLLDEETRRSAYFTAALQPFYGGSQMVICWTAGLPWIEIDTFEDLERARSEVFPLIEAVLLPE